MLRPISKNPVPPLVLGILGGIASGKSRVAHLLAGSGGVHLEADRLAHEALETPEVIARITRLWGSDCLEESGRPDRAALGTRVFADPEARQTLEGWIHPIVRERILEALREAEQAQVERLVLDVPLLLENNEQHQLLSHCHYLIFVHSPLTDREERAVRDRGWQESEVSRREATQLPLEEKRNQAHFVVENCGNLEQLDAAVERLLDQLEDPKNPSRRT